MTFELEGAIRAAKGGWRVFPAHSLVATVDGLLCTCGNPDCDSAGKHPAFSGWQKKATTNLKTIENWWSQHPDRNPAIATGNGIVVLDVDGETGKESLKRLEQEHEPLPETVTSVTGGGGNHYFFRTDRRDIPCSVSKIAPKLDIRAEGGLVIAPGAIHKSGRRYEWEILCSPEDVAIADLPPWLEKLALEAGSKSPAQNAEIPAATNGENKSWLELALSNDPILNGKDRTDGGRNQDLFHMGCALRGKKGYTMAEIDKWLHETNEKRCVPPKPESEIRKILRQIDQYPRGGGAEEVFKPTGLIPFSSIIYEEPHFLIKPYLPIGKLTLLQGDPNMGKTSVICKIAALVSKGEPWVDIPCEQGNTLIVSVEDDDTALFGRLESSGADVTKCFMLPEADAKELKFSDIETLEPYIRDQHIRLIIFDPIQSFLGSKVDMNRANETRPILAGLSEFASRMECAILLISHMGKGSKDSIAMYRSLGSIDITAAMRSGLQVDEHIMHPGKRFLYQFKSSNAPIGKTIEYSIHERAGVTFDKFSPLTEKDFRDQNKNSQLLKFVRTEPEAGRLIEACQKVLDVHPNGTTVLYDELVFVWPDGSQKWPIVAACISKLAEAGIYVERKTKNGRGALLIQPMKNRERVE